MVAKKAKYTPIGDSVSTQAMVLQAADALDVAAAIAIESNDAEGLLKVAAAWLEMGAVVSVGPPNQQGESMRSVQPMGFVPDGEQDDGKESDGTPRVDPQHGEFRISPRRPRDRV